MDKLAMYKEEIYKVAFDDEEKIHKKILMKQLKKPVITKNTTNKKYLGFHEYHEPNNFRGGKNVSTVAGVEFIPKKNDVSYNTSTTGEGLKSPVLIAHKFHGDFLKDHRKGETEKQYEQRKKQGVKKAIKTRNRWLAGGLAGLGATTVAGTVSGTKFFPQNKALGGTIGAMYGMGIGMAPAGLAIMHGVKKSQKNYLKGLKPHELEQLLKMKHDDAKEVSQDARKAHLMQELYWNQA